MSQVKSMKLASNISAGDTLWWEDPDDSLCSRVIIITFVDEEQSIARDHEGTEYFFHELFEINI